MELTHDQEDDVYMTINNTTGCIGLKNQIKELSEAAWMNEGPHDYEAYKQAFNYTEREEKSEAPHKLFNDKYLAAGGLYTRTKWCQANKVIKDTYRALIDAGVKF